ncbi:UNVERIFIED_CONTAM: hypothetical protein FKN15_072490 [Acipenser sinensis]
MAKLGALSAPSDFQSQERFLPQCSMGSVGSGVAGQQEFAMKSVGTRTQQSSGGVRSNGFSKREFQRCYSGEERTYSSEKMLVSNSLYINSEQRRSGERRVKVDLCGNVTTNNERNSSTGNLPPLQYRDPPSTDLSQQPPPISANNTTGNSKLEHPPKILPVSGKLEQVLHMRRNLDQSEAAIVQVFEEKQRIWEREMEELRQNYANKLQQVSRKTQRAQQAVQLQSARLQQDKRRLQDELSTLLAQREELERKCLDQLALEWCEGELQRTLAEVSLLRDKLGMFEAEVLGLKQALAGLGGGGGAPHTPPALPPQCQSDQLLQSCQSDEVKAQRQAEAEADVLRRQLETLQAELRLERQQRERQAISFAEERHTWQGEKDKVLKYQAQLQLNYVEMYQKNQALEQHVDELGPKLPPSANAPNPALNPAPIPNPNPAPAPSHTPGVDKRLKTPPWGGPSRLERIESTEI